ncbi:unnamed protein product [Phytophthora fragariaefolia]|uniref:Unnamed protein product n=1 Tax=Phytophthora fragariaefolia TaxID=1490495 RepID=A0A9W6X9G0_9STRA|nr:unnamed protein product [Phytophthora fragariaefolia]
MTEDGIFTPTRLQQGSVDSYIHFQQSVEKIMRDADLLVNEGFVVVGARDFILASPDAIREVVESQVHIVPFAEVISDRGEGLQPVVALQLFPASLRDVRGWPNDWTRFDRPRSKKPETH